MNDIPICIERLAQAAENEISVVRIWTVATLASRLGLEAIVSAAPDPVEAIAEVGDLWAAGVEEALEDAPDRQADTLRAAHAVVQRLFRCIPSELRSSRSPRSTRARAM